jgi:hypothetical protein
MAGARPRALHGDGPGFGGWGGLPAPTAASAPAANAGRERRCERRAQRDLPQRLSPHQGL